MSKRLLTILALLVAVAALAGSAAAKPALHSTRQSVVPIAMHDPGCHWFAVDGGFYKGLSVAGKTTFRNVDEATLIVKGSGFHATIPVGKSLAIANAGTYHITMVGQAPDDNHLLLLVK